MSLVLHCRGPRRANIAINNYTQNTSIRTSLGYYTKQPRISNSGYEQSRQLSSLVGHSQWGFVFWRGCATSSTDSQVDVATQSFRLLHGLEGVAKDEKKAMELLNSAVEAGNIDATFRLGRCYLNGTGVSVDYDKALDLLQKAADGGHAAAQMCMGSYYLVGFGKIKKDKAKAVQYLQKAADQGHIEAMHRLAVCYHQEEGVPRDYAKAFDLFMKAAEKGHNLATYHVGICYKLGTGVEKDLMKAREWILKADVPQSDEAIVDEALFGITMEQKIEAELKKDFTFTGPLEELKKARAAAKGGAKQQKKGK